MTTLSILHFERRSRFSRALAILSLLGLSLHSALHAQRITLAVRTPASTATDAGPVPASQPMQLTLRLALAADRSAALDDLLASQTTPHSSAYHQWLTPQQFASQFGATDDQLAATTAWLQSQGLNVDAISTSRTRMTVSGTAAQVQSAFAVTLRRYQVANALYVANATQPSLPSEAAALVAGVSGLNNLPTAAAAAPANATTATAKTRSANPTQTADPYLTAASAVDANTTPILTLDTVDCSSDFAQSDYDAYRDLFRQANAQGITVLAATGCGDRGTGSFPASLGEVTALTISPTNAPFAPIAPRPAWQSAPGLPADSLRYEPDLTTTSLTCLRPDRQHHHSTDGHAPGQHQRSALLAWTDAWPLHATRRDTPQPSPAHGSPQPASASSICRHSSRSTRAPLAPHPRRRRSPPAALPSASANPSRSLLSLRPRPR